MKGTLTIIVIGIASFFCISTNNDDLKYEVPDFTTFDAKVAGLKEDIKTHKEINEKGENYLLDTIHHLGINHSRNSNKLAVVSRPVPQIKQVRQNTHNTTICKYKTVVYTIFTTRGAHVRSDTLEPSTFEILTHRNNHN